MSELRVTTITDEEGTGSPAFPNGVIIGDVDVAALQDAIDSAIDSATTDNIQEGSNLYYTTTRFDSDFGDNTTDDLTEGSSNLYYTSVRVNSDVTDLLTGDISTGNITTTGYVRGPSTFVIDPATHGDSTGTLRILGGLTVEGTTTTINSTTVTVDDKNVVLAEGAIDSAASDGAGITVNGSGASILYDHTNSSWDFNRNIEAVSIQNTPIGSSTASSGAFSTLSASGDVDFDAGTLFVDASADAVGIGTTSPSVKLHVNGDVRASTVQSDNNIVVGEAIPLHANYSSADGGAPALRLGSNASGPGFWDFQPTGTNSGDLAIEKNDTERMRITSSGDVLPGANGTQDLGSSTLRWNTVYTSDLSLKNDHGDWTIVEGEDDLFLYNNKKNKVYKFALTEVDPDIAPPKRD